MYPGFISHWQRHHRGDSRASAGAGCGSRAGSYRAEGYAYRASRGDDDADAGLGGSFGVRRPLRFLAYKLQLQEAQVAQLARILDEIKTERAQAAVDNRRALSAFADAIEGEKFDKPRAEAAAAIRLQTAERLREAVVTALGRLHELLDLEQRERLAYLIRTGTLSI
ncbi:MAG TPA: Spy/CpxP family protein refolding chaperone [Thermoanaerobaculia bacterium]